MGLRIQTNVNSLFAQRQLGISTERLNTHTQRISSGLRINKAADDAAGLAISEKFRSHIRSLQQARRNASDGVSLVQTAEGGLNEVTNIVVRLRELAIQAASDTVGDTERGYLQMEFGSLKNEIERIAFAAEYNGTRLLTGTSELPEAFARNHNESPLEVQVGVAWHEETDSLDVRNPTHVIRIDLNSINALLDGPGSLELGAVEDEEGTRVDSKFTAQRSISRLESALERINGYRATLGAVQNRLGSTISNISTQMENLEAAKSRIRDADYADESAQVVQQGILQKAGVAVLAQANQMPELATKLLQ